MKTRGLNKVLMLSLVFAAFTGCQEDEFYEKEYIDGAIEQYEREKRTIEEDDLAEQVNDEDLDQNINPPAPGDDDDSTNPGGGNPGNNVGDTDDGGGDDDDGIADNDDGMGDDDDGIADNDDGDYDDGDGDNDDGIADNDDDTTSPPVPPTPGPTIVSKSDAFSQKGSAAPIDILWVVDNSGSMADEQQALADNFSAFIADFVTKDIDFKMAITTTDRNRGALSHSPTEMANMEKLSKEAMLSNSDQFQQDFKDLIKVGTRGYGIEKGLKSSEVWTDVYANHFLRKDAYYILVYVTDERDQSEKDVEDHLAQIAKWKQNSGLIKAYSIVDMDNLVSTQYILKGYDRYKEMSDLTGGYVANINDDFASVLKTMGGSIANLADQFPLSSVPYAADSIVVKVNGVETVEWDYNADTNTIKFHATAVPADGSSIEVTYNVEKK